ncbi:MAG TPA: hypothetical protein VFI02_17290 [Armatimonadota bacterium]|nr:hypothetical protein [Armatimonadota bacterium]
MAPSESMSLPASRRHRLVKIREEIVRSKGRGGGSAAPARHATGLNSRGGGNVTGQSSTSQDLGANWSV